MTERATSESLLAELEGLRVSRYATATGSRLRCQRSLPEPVEVCFDALELEGLTRIRHKPLAVLGEQQPGAPDEKVSIEIDHLELLQNEFAMVGVSSARRGPKAGLLIQDMNGGQRVFLDSSELSMLMRAKHMDLAPLIDTSDLTALPEPEIDEL